MKGIFAIAEKLPYTVPKVKVTQIVIIGAGPAGLRDCMERLDWC